MPGYWPDAAERPAHDVVLCAHAIYGAADFAAFVNRMTRTTARACYLLLKVPAPDGVMAEAANRIWGQPHDSPNFVVAYNALIQMGIAADVRIDPTRWGTWKSPSLDEAVADVKRRLAVGDSTAHDAYLRDLLGRRLTPRDGEYIWPPSVSSALVWWRTR